MSSSPKHFISKIDDFLYLGNEAAALNLDLIRSHGISHILQLIPLKTHDSTLASLTILKLPTQGGRKSNIKPVLHQSLAFINSAVQAKQTVLVHCKFGQNRSASIVIAYLMATRKLNYKEAEKLVKEKSDGKVAVKNRVKVFLSGLSNEYLQDILY